MQQDHSHSKDESQLTGWGWMVCAVLGEEQYTVWQALSITAFQCPTLVVVVLLQQLPTHVPLGQHALHMKPAALDWAVTYQNQISSMQ